MPPRTKSPADNIPHAGVRPVKHVGILDARERDLPPLPDDCTDDDSDPPPPVTHSFGPHSKRPPPSLTPPFEQPSTHDVFFPTYTPPRSTARPKLILDTGWSPFAFPAPSASPHKAIQDKPVHLNAPAPAAQCSCLLSAVRKTVSPLPRVVRAAATTRATSPRATAKPFMRSDARHPALGVTVTVHRERLVSEAVPPRIGFMTNVSSASLDKPLPSLVAEREKEQREQAAPAASDIPQPSADPDPSAPPPTISAPKKLRVHRVPVPRA